MTTAADGDHILNPQIIVKSASCAAMNKRKMGLQ